MSSAWVEARQYTWPPARVSGGGPWLGAVNITYIILCIRGFKKGVNCTSAKCRSYIGIERGYDRVVHGELDTVEGGDLGQEGDETILIHLQSLIISFSIPLIKQLTNYLKLTNSERYSLWKYFNGTDS